MFSLVRALDVSHNTHSTNQCHSSILWDRETNTLKQRCSSFSVFEGHLVESHKITKSAKLRHGRDDDVHQRLLFFYFDRCTISPVWPMSGSRTWTESRRYRAYPPKSRFSLKRVPLALFSRPHLSSSLNNHQLRYVFLLGGGVLTSSVD